MGSGVTMQLMDCATCYSRYCALVGNTPDHAAADAIYAAYHTGPAAADQLDGADSPLPQGDEWGE